MKQFSIMAVHAHPDDECTSTGAVLARYSAEGHRTIVVTCTGGELGEIADPALATPENLAEVRKAELEIACSILGVSQIHMLGYRDSGMADTPDNAHPASFHQIDLEEAAGRLVELVRRERPEILVTYDENGFYGHPDHIKANQITLAAWDAAGDPARYPELGLEPWTPLKLYYTAIPRSAILEMPERLREAGIDSPFGDEEPSFGSPDELVTTYIDAGPWVEKKRLALLSHKTQMGPEVFFAHLPNELFDEMFGIEAFIREASRIEAPGREDDLLAGLW